MNIYVVSDGYDVLGVFENIDGAKLMCDVHGYDRIDEYKLNKPNPIKCWMYSYGKWEEFKL